MTSVSSSTVNEFFNTFWVHLNQFNRASGPEKEAIREGSIRVRRLDSFARLIVKDQTTDNCAAVALVKHVWHITANNFVTIKKNLNAIYKALGEIETDNVGMVTSTKIARRRLLEEYLKSVASPVVKARLARDVRKFLSSLKTTTIFKKMEIKKLLNNDYTRHENPLQLHAEIELLSSLLLIERKGVTVTLGISKLCCKLCAAALAAFQKHLTVDFRGRHGNFYFAWRPSQQLLGKKLFTPFIGQEAADLFSSANTKTRKKIIEILKGLTDYRDTLKQHGRFIPSRGNVMLRSGSPTPESTEVLGTKFEALTVRESSQQSIFSEELNEESEEWLDDSLSEEQGSE